AMVVTQVAKATPITSSAFVISVMLSHPGRKAVDQSLLSKAESLIRVARPEGPSVPIADRPQKADQAGAVGLGKAGEKTVFMHLHHPFNFGRKAAPGGGQGQ